MNVVVVLLFLVLINAYFAATEISVVSTDKDDIEEALGPRAESGLVKSCWTILRSFLLCTDWCNVSWIPYVVLLCFGLGWPI